MVIEATAFGCGVQSMALMVLAKQREIAPRLFLFANVGADSEDPDTLTYLAEHATPYAAAHGLELVQLQRRWKRGERAGQTETLLSRLERGNTAIPVRRRKDGPPMSRSCTADFKTRVIRDELVRRGATPDDPARVSLGISTDEIERAKPGRDSQYPEQIRTYPLLDLGHRRRRPTRPACRRARPTHSPCTSPATASRSARWWTATSTSCQAWTPATLGGA